MLVVDLGQSGSRFQLSNEKQVLTRGKLSSETVLESLREVFALIPKIQADVVSLSCTGFNGVLCCDAGGNSFLSCKVW